MAINRSRDMRAELEQGVIDGTYMQLYPGHGGQVEQWNADRMEWPTYARVEQRPNPPAVLGGPYKVNDNDLDDVGR